MGIREGSTTDDRATAAPARPAIGRWFLALRERPERPALDTPFGSRSAFGMAVWFGLAVGLAELGLTLALKPLRDPSPGLFRMNRHILWTIPTINLVVFGLCGLILALVVRAWPRQAVRLTLGVLSAVAGLTLLLIYRRLFMWACLVLAAGLAYEAVVRLEANLAGFRRLLRWSMPVLAAVAVVLVGFSLGRHALREHWAMGLLLPTTSNGPNAPNVLLIVLDTVRADRLGLYGYGRDTTPNLSRLAKRGITFTEARSTAPWTLPSHASMMTGRWPHQLSAGLHGPLDATHATLAEFLAENGYATAGFVANTTYCSAETGLDRGFAHYEDHDLSLGNLLRTSAMGERVLSYAVLRTCRWLGKPLDPKLRKDAKQLGRDLLAWTDRQRDRPFFAFMNFFDAHNPYVPPYDFKRRYSTATKTFEEVRILDQWFILEKSKLTAAQVAFVNDAYDDCLVYLDEQLGRLLDELDRRGRLANTLVVVTADHGEHFGEHRLYGHASSLYDQEIRVPLLVLLPEGREAGTTVTAPVSLRDLPATVAGLLGLGVGSPFPGRSLARCWAPASHPTAAEPALSEVDAPVKGAPNQGRSPVFRGPMKALVSGREVYIRNGDGEEEVYDLAADPAQARNLVGTASAGPRLASFRATLEQMTRDDSRPPEWRGLVPQRRQTAKAAGPATRVR